jgi:hypothetical protein
VHELATLITEMVMITLKIEGSALIPARRMAITKGENLEFAPEEFNKFGLSDGTINPRRNNDRM